MRDSLQSFTKASQPELLVYQMQRLRELNLEYETFDAKPQTLNPIGPNRLRNTVTFNACISACEEAGKWKACLEEGHIFHERCRLGV